jgi:hypothetical protein
LYTEAKEPLPTDSTTLKSESGISEGERERERGREGYTLVREKCKE